MTLFFFFSLKGSRADRAPSSYASAKKKDTKWCGVPWALTTATGGTLRVDYRAHFGGLG
jgi:hypothetical protein